MTQEEYIETLQAALLVAKDHLRNPFEPDNQSGVYARVNQALAVPQPTEVDLMPIADAPTDGNPFLIYNARHRAAKIACLIGKNPNKWRVSDDTERYTMEWLREEFVGWLPLPKVRR
jgi:hypothetical protein